MTQRTELDLDAIEARAKDATDGGHGWRLADLPGANEVWADRDAAGHDAFMVATTATRLNPNPGVRGHADAAHIAGMSPTVTLALVDEIRRLRAGVSQ
jgi:hypothetical protein